MANDARKKAMVVQFGLSLVPLVGGALATALGGTAPIMFNLSAGPLVSFLTGTLERIGNVAISSLPNDLTTSFASIADEVSIEGTTSAAVYIQLAAVVYSPDFEEFLRSHGRPDTWQRLQTIAGLQGRPSPELIDHLVSMASGNVGANA